MQKIAKDKTKRFLNQTYWERPLTGFGNPNAQLLIVGLAPAAHGETEQEECLQETILMIGLQGYYMNMVLQISLQVKISMMALGCVIPISQQPFAVHPHKTNP